MGLKGFYQKEEYVAGRTWRNKSNECSKCKTPIDSSLQNINCGHYNLYPDRRYYCWECYKKLPDWQFDSAMEHGIVHHIREKFRTKKERLNYTFLEDRASGWICPLPASVKGIIFKDNVYVTDLDWHVLTEALIWKISNGQVTFNEFRGFMSYMRPLYSVYRKYKNICSDTILVKTSIAKTFAKAYVKFRNEVIKKEETPVHDRIERRKYGT